jgi:hypothetical protein
MGEIVYFLGAPVPLISLIYGTLHYHHRHRAASRVGDEIVREQYRRSNLIHFPANPRHHA